MATIKLFDGDLGDEQILVRCDLSQASSPVEIDYGEGFEPTQYQCTDVKHSVMLMVVRGKELAARSVDVSESDFDCEWDLNE